MNLDHQFAPYRPPATHLVDRLRYWVDQQPTAISFFYLVDGDDEEVHLTYRQLDLRARAIAAKLTSMHLCGERALLLFPPGLGFIEAFFGCLYAGVVPVPAYPPRRNRNMNRIQAISDDAQAKVALTVPDVIDRLKGMLDETPSLLSLLWLTTAQVADDWAENWRMPDISNDTLAVLQYTSGSTGTPKGVVLTHGNLMHNCALITRAFEFSRTGCGMTWLPTYHDMGLLGGVLSPLFFGRPNVLMSPMAFLQRPVRWLRAITRYEVTVSGGPNFAYALCTEKITPDECQGIDLHTWDVAFNGAEPIRPETLEEFTRKFAPYGFRAETHYPCYGMAETTLIVTGGDKKELPIVRAFDARALETHQVVALRNGQSMSRRLVGCGRVLPDEEVVIVDPETQAPVSPDRVGEIWVRSPSVGQGYWNKPDDTQRVFRARLSNGDVRTWLRTGDLGFLHDGELFVTGRLKDLIITRGVNRYPQDIEATVEQVHERLRMGGSAAFAVDVEGRERLVVVCEVERGGQVQWSEIIDAIRRQVAAEHELSVDAVVLVRSGSIPKTSSGKIQRHACRSSFLDNQLLIVEQWIGWRDEASTTPETTLSAAGRNGKTQVATNPQIAKIVLEQVKAVVKDRARDLTLDSNIVVDLGLDSLDRLQIANALEETFGGRFPDDVLQRIETCREVASAIEQYIGSSPTDERETVSKRTVGLACDTHSRVPVAHFQIDQFPEFVRLQHAKAMLASSGLQNPFFRAHEGAAKETAWLDGRQMISFASCDYLGMSSDAVVARAAKDAIDRYGTSVSASRLVSGEREIHRELERELAEFLGTEDAVVFVSAHATNETTIGHLFGPGDLVLYDALAHNSIIKGAELSGARRRPFQHNNPQAVDEFLRDERHQYRRVLIALNGVDSVDGDYPDLPRFIEVKRRHQALMLVDEAHSLGTLGMCGRGLSEHFRTDIREIEISMGSLSKSLGSCGGYIAGTKRLVDLLRYTVPGFVFATGISPANAAAALAALRLLRAEPERVAMLQTNARLFATLAKQRNLEIAHGKNTPIISIIVGNSLHAMQLSARLIERGILAQPIIHPAVSEAHACVRFLISASHKEDQIRTAVAAVAEELAKILPTDAVAQPCRG